jgi:hypothetical protein
MILEFPIYFFLTLNWSNTSRTNYQGRISLKLLDPHYHSHHLNPPHQEHQQQLHM